LVVRVKLKIKGKNKEVITSALVNSGFEATEPQLIIPLSLAEAIGVTSMEADIEDFSVAAGNKVSGYRIKEPIEVELILEDREPIKTQAAVTILPGEVEAIISDYLASALNIAILNPRHGDWCLQDEIGTKRRTSTPPEEWR